MIAATLITEARFALAARITARCCCTEADDLSSSFSALFCLAKSCARALHFCFACLTFWRFSTLLLACALSAMI
jgi:hypothetical protein